MDGGWERVVRDDEGPEVSPEPMMVQRRYAPATLGAQFEYPKPVRLEMQR